MIRQCKVSAILLVIAVLGAAGVVVCGKQIAPLLQQKVFEVLVQLVLLAGVGGVASLVVEDLQRAREQREKKRERLRTTLSDLITAYNEVKAIRRQLRAEGVTPTYEDAKATIVPDVYISLMRRLNDAQLKIEAYVRLIDGNRDLYVDSEAIRRSLEKAEEYLGGVIEEWEKGRKDRGKSCPEEWALNECAVLKKFMSKSGDSFGPSFADPMSTVLLNLSEAISK